MVNATSENPYNLDKLSVQNLKELFPAVFYPDQNALAAHLTTSLLVEELEVAGGEFTGETAFWLKILSTPNKPKTQLQKIQFKRNVYNAYNHFVEPLLHNKPPGCGQDASNRSALDAPATKTATDDGSGGSKPSHPSQPPSHASPNRSLLTAVTPAALVSQPADGSVITDAGPSEEALDAVESTSSVVATPLSSKRKKPAACALVTQQVDQSGNDAVGDLMKIFKCKLCDASFASLSELKNHHYTEHADVFCVPCKAPGCTYRCRNTWTLKSHTLTMHSDEKGYPCDSCDLAFKTSNLLIRHRNDEHLKKVKKCDRCDFTCKFSDRVRLSQHKYSAHGVPLPNACKLCSFSAHSRTALSHHMNSAHTRSCRHSCPNCSYSTYTVQSLHAHVRTCGPENFARNANFGRNAAKSALARSTAADKVTAFWCSECGQNFSFEHTANLHVAKSHLPKVAMAVPTNSSKAGTLTFKCSVCDFSSLFKYELDVHLGDSHDGAAVLMAEYIEDENYVPPVVRCPHCPFSAATLAAVSSHMRARHERVVRQCHLCDYKTFHKNGLSSHLHLKHGAPRKCPPKISKKRKASNVQAQSATASVASTPTALSPDRTQEDTSGSNRLGEFGSSPANH